MRQDQKQEIEQIGVAIRAIDERLSQLERLCIPPEGLNVFEPEPVQQEEPAKPKAHKSTKRSKE